MYIGCISFAFLYKYLFVLQAAVNNHYNIPKKETEYSSNISVI